MSKSLKALMNQPPPFSPANSGFYNPFAVSEIKIYIYCLQFPEHEKYVAAWDNVDHVPWMKRNNRSTLRFDSLWQLVGPLR